MSTFIKAGFWEKLCKPCKGYKGWLNLDELIESKIPAPTPPSYKVYTAIITQSGTNPPSEVNVLENTIGEITFEYVSPAQYKIKSSGLFKTNKTITNVQNYNAYFRPTIIANNSFEKTSTGFINESEMWLLTPVVDVNGVISQFVDGVLGNFLIEIRVYN